MAPRAQQQSPRTSGGSSDGNVSSSGTEDYQRQASMSAQPSSSQQIRNPRRAPAHRSVSLMHGPPYTSGSKLSSAPHQIGNNFAPSMTAEPPSTVSSKPLCMKDSSGESSNADNWFEKSNNKVRPSPALLTEDDPPFLLRNGSSSGSPDHGPAGQLITSHASSSHILNRPGFAFIPTLGSSSEDFRSVIDDLTVENKKLKRKLKKYEKLQDSHLQDEKLFEVRVHGLPANKKRELEEMLRKFVVSCEGRQADQASSQDYERVGARLPTRPTTSSHASTRPNDSAYGSMSISGPRSSGQVAQYGPSPSAQGSSSQSRRQSKMASSQSNQHISHQQHENIRSYLHDIPAGLLPKEPIAMTEKAKQKLVVRRLESVFAGKASNSVGHQQPIQQQEVSHMAARADRSAIEATGERFPEEGAREAFIMRGNGDEKKKKKVDRRVASLPAETSIASNEDDVEEHDFARDASTDPVEQRPTRPLDLDPYRAQVAAENIQYIRHLGFSPLDAGSIAAHEEGHGWIYMNLLINMAQLHTLNVTTEFVQKAVADVSRKLEMSSDGRKLRWRGGFELTRTSSDSSPDDDHRTTNQMAQKHELRKRSKLSTAIVHDQDDASESLSKSNKASSRDRLAYTPLFFHKQVEEDEEMSDDDSVSGWSSPQRQVAGDSSGLTSSGNRTASTRRKRADNGPIIFYNRVNFCTDLSGDARGKELAFVNNTGYNRLASVPIGAEVHEVTTPAAEPRGPLFAAHSVASSDAMDVDKASTSELAMDIDVPKPASLSNASSEDSVDTPLSPFEASGVGGILPEDHFSIRVKAQRSLAKAATSTLPNNGKLIPRQMRALLLRNNTEGVTSNPAEQPIVRQKVISERCKVLPPSALPPPSFLPQDSGLGDSDCSDYSDDSAGEEEDDDQVQGIPAEALPVPSAAPQALNWPILDSTDDESLASTSGSDDEGDEDDCADSSSSGSLDLLAYAREVDPATIRAREREYDSQMAERLAEEIPAGSSAATAGGGSGFNSPAGALNVEEVGEAQSAEGRKVAAAAARNLKRARMSDGVNGEETVQARVRKSPKLSGEVRS